MKLIFKMIYVKVEHVSPNSSLFEFSPLALQVSVFCGKRDTLLSVWRPISTAPSMAATDVMETCGGTSSGPHLCHRLRPSHLLLLNDAHSSSMLWTPRLPILF